VRFTHFGPMRCLRQITSEPRPVWLRLLEFPQHVFCFSGLRVALALTAPPLRMSFFSRKFFFPLSRHRLGFFKTEELTLYDAGAADVTLSLSRLLTSWLTEDGRSRMGQWAVSFCSFDSVCEPLNFRWTRLYLLRLPCFSTASWHFQGGNCVR